MAYLLKLTILWGITLRFSEVLKMNIKFPVKDKAQAWLLSKIFSSMGITSIVDVEYRCWDYSQHPVRHIVRAEIPYNLIIEEDCYDKNI